MQKKEVKVQPKKEVPKKTEPQQLPEETTTVTVEVTETVEMPKVEEQTIKIPIKEVKPMRPPEFTRHLEPITAQDGDKVVFEVEFRGVPSPTIEWYHNNHRIQPSTDFQIYIDIERCYSSMVVIEVFPEDAGEYTCRATNPVGEAMTSCTLTVLGKNYFFHSAFRSVDQFLRLYQKKFQFFEKLLKKFEIRQYEKDG